MRRTEQVEMAIVLTFADAVKAKMPGALHVAAMVKMAITLMGNEEQASTAVNRVVRRGMAVIEKHAEGDCLIPTAKGLAKGKSLRKLFA